MKNPYRNLKLLTILSTILMLMCSCTKSSSSANLPTGTPAPFSPIAFPTTYIRSTATINFSMTKSTEASTSAYLIKQIIGIPSAFAENSSITSNIKNTYKSIMTVDTGNIVIPTKIYPQRLALGNINIDSLMDSGLNNCGGLQCNLAYVQAYFVESAAAGFSNGSSLAPVYLNKIQLKAGESNAIKLQSQVIPSNKTNFSRSDFVIPPSYSLEADFSSLPSGTYSGKIVIEYVLQQVPVLTPSAPPVVSFNSFNTTQGIYQGASTQQINWTATGSNLYYKPITFEFSQDGGTTWSPIVSAIENSGTYNWVVPAVDTTQGQLRLTAVDLSGNVSQTTSSLFIVDSTNPVITISSFQGAPKYPGGATLNINYTATDANFGPTPIKIEYTPDGGVNWFSIVNNSTNSGSRNWTIPSIDTPNAMVRVTATDKAGNIQTAVSGLFTIDSTPPTLILTSLKSKLLYAGGTTQNITWTASDTNFGPSPIKIEYSIDSGNSWASLTSGAANTGSYAWTLPTIDSSKMEVRITATDQVGNIFVASTGDGAAPVGSNDFEIDSTSPNLVLNSPTGGQFFSATTAQLITWTGSDKNLANNPVSIDLSTDGGSTWSPIVAATANNGSYSWTVPSINSNTSFIRVTIKDSVGHTSQALSTTPITISKGFPNTLSLLSGSGQTIARNLTTQSPLRVQLLDQYSQPVKPNTPVIFSILSGGGVMIAANVNANNTTGNADGYYTAGPTLGTVTIKATATKEDGTILSGNFTVTVANYAPLTATASVNGSPEYVFFNKSAVGVPPSGSGLSSVDSTFSSNFGGLTYILNSVNAIPSIISATQSLYNVGVNLTKLTDIISFTTAATYPAPVTSGSCTTVSSVTTLNGQSCSISSGGIDFSFNRSQVDNGTLKFRISSSGSGPLDYLDTSSFSLSRNSIKAISETNPLSDDGITTRPVIYDNRVYFGAKNSSGAIKLYAYDQTAGIVSQISNLSGSATISDNITEMAIYNNQLFFSGQKIMGAQKLFKYCDGNSAVNCGVESIKQITNIAGSSVSDTSSFLTSLNGFLYFKGTLSTGFTKLFRYCDSVGCGVTGVYQVADINSGFDDAIGDMIPYGGYLFFSALNPSGKLKLFQFCDGYNCGTKSLAQVANTAGSSLDDSPGSFLVYSGVMYFSSSNGSGYSKLYSYDYTQNQFNQLSNVFPTGSDSPNLKTSFGGEIYFTSVADSSGVRKLYKLTPSSAVQIPSIKQVTNLYANNSDSIQELVTYNNTLFISGKTALGINKLMRIKNGNVEQVSNLASGDNDDVKYLTTVGNTLFFKAKAGATNYKLYRYCEVSTGCTP